MGTRGRDSDGDEKDTHISVRVDKQTTNFVDQLGREFGYVRDSGEVNRSKTLRTVIKAHNGILFGNFFGVVDSEKLAEEWGDVGSLLSAAVESDQDMPPALDHAQLAEVLAPIPVLVRAAEVELEEPGGD